MKIIRVFIKHDIVIVPYFITPSVFFCKCFASACNSSYNLGTWIKNKFRSLSKNILAVWSIWSLEKFFTKLIQTI